MPTSSDSEESDPASEPVKETDEIWETAERETSSDVSASAPDKEGARIVVVVCPTFLRLPPVVPDSSTLVVVVFLLLSACDGSWHLGDRSCSWHMK